MIIGIIAGIVYLIIIGWLGSWLAAKKGYSSVAWFFICVLTGPFGIIVLAGAPSQYTELYLEEIKRKLDSRSTENQLNSKPINPIPSVKLSGKTWFCNKCQTENAATANSCKGCGEYR